MSSLVRNSRSMDDQIRAALHPFLHILDGVVETHQCVVARDHTFDIPLERGLMLVWAFPTFHKDLGPWRSGDKLYALTLHLDTWQLVETNNSGLLVRECPVSLALKTV